MDKISFSVYILYRVSVYIIVYGNVEATEVEIFMRQQLWLDLQRGVLYVQ